MTTLRAVYESDKDAMHVFLNGRRENMQKAGVTDQFGRTRWDAIRKAGGTGKPVVSWRSCGTYFTWHASAMWDETTARSFADFLKRDITVAANTVLITWEDDING